MWSLNWGIGGSRIVAKTVVQLFQWPSGRAIENLIGGNLATRTQSRQTPIFTDEEIKQIHDCTPVITQTGSAPELSKQSRHVFTILGP
jgi:hypothetical protein